jgi:hypothetical protein
MKFPEVRISDKDLQGKFNANEGGYPLKIDSLRRQTVYSRPASPKSKQKAGTLSTLYKYWDGDVPVMYLHCFVEKSGALGASKKMDPKRLLVNGVSYFCD